MVGQRTRRSGCLSPALPSVVKSTPLCWPAGTGKTMTVSARAGELQLPLFKVRLEALFSRFFGETGASCGCCSTKSRRPAASTRTCSTNSTRSAHAEAIRAMSARSVACSIRCLPHGGAELHRQPRVMPQTTSRSWTRRWRAMLQRAATFRRKLSRLPLAASRRRSPAFGGIRAVLPMPLPPLTSPPSFRT